ncbi:MAG: LysR family transcriptional regulator [Bacteroides sp.]|nr:LysR family transcriptional regulator [Prevotella sp.]MCM1408705.1 LysR family transcriptional regulator [Treponema brennaborense]MCM1470620.1 LysR family transcriptional regulator [Bacteroides sp.]
MIETYILEHLAAFSECGTFSGAAEMLNTSQPAITRSMKKLESELGVSLFVRTKNKVALNKTGLAAAAYAKKIIALCEEMAENVALLEKQNHAVLVGSVAPAPIWVLNENPPKDFGGRKIEWKIMDEKKLLKELSSGKCECAIFNFAAENTAEISKRFYPKRAAEIPQKFSSQKICLEKLFFSLPKTHRLAHRKSLSFSQMDGETFIVASQIGFWDVLQKEHLPHSRFITQSDKTALEEITRNSSLPHFVSDLSLHFQNRPVQEKAVIPIRDKSATQEFFLWKKK